MLQCDQTRRGTDPEMKVSFAIRMGRWDPRGFVTLRFTQEPMSDSNVVARKKHKQDMHRVKAKQCSYLLVCKSIPTQDFRHCYPFGVRECYGGMIARLVPRGARTAV